MQRAILINLFIQIVKITLVFCLKKLSNFPKILANSDIKYSNYINWPLCLLNVNCSRSGSNGKIEAVQTSKTTLYSKKAIVLAAGCWSGTLLRDLLREGKTVLDVPIMPRKVLSIDIIYFFIRDVFMLMLFFSAVYSWHYYLFYR